MTETGEQKGAFGLAAAWTACALGALALLGAVHLAVGGGALPYTWDERYALAIVERIWRAEWLVRSLLDYDDTKGPVFFWLYAGWGELFGRDAAVLRWLSILATALWTATLLGLLDPSRQTAARLAAVTLLAITMPYATVMSQLVMSEPTFLLGCSLTAVAAAAALRSDDRRTRLVEGPILFGLLLAVGLHHRIHVVALAGAIVVLAMLRDRAQSWPWIAAMLLAGLSRLPLYLRWGGLVGESFRDRYSIGLRFDSLSYLLAALLPTIALALVMMVLRRREMGAAAVRAVAAAAVVGAALALLAPPGITSDLQDLRFAGPVATALRPLADSPVLFRCVIMALAALGAASLASVVLLAWRGTADGQAALQSESLSSFAARLAALTILFGWMLSALASGDVYDRYLLAFTFLWPLWCVRLMPRPFLIAQVVWQALVTGCQVWSVLGAR